MISNLHWTASVWPFLSAISTCSVFTMLTNSSCGVAFTVPFGDLEHFQFSSPLSERPMETSPSADTHPQPTFDYPAGHLQGQTQLDVARPGMWISWISSRNLLNWPRKNNAEHRTCFARQICPPAVENDRPTRDYLEVIKTKSIAVVSHQVLIQTFIWPGMKE